jgi:hypothetical protein
MRYKSIATLLALPLLALSFSAMAADATGRWKTIDDKTGKVKSIVEITKATNGSLSGKVVEVLYSERGPNPVCDKCSGANKNKPVKGSWTPPTARPTNRRPSCRPEATNWTCPDA